MSSRNWVTVVRLERNTGSCILATFVMGTSRAHDPLQVIAVNGLYAEMVTTDAVERSEFYHDICTKYREVRDELTEFFVDCEKFASPNARQLLPGLWIKGERLYVTDV